MRLPWIAILLLIPTAYASDVESGTDRPSVLDTAFHPPDLVPRMCAGALGMEVFVPVQYAHAHEVPVVLLVGTNSGSFRVSWGAIDQPDHGAAWVQGVAMLDSAARSCGIAADPIRLDGIQVKIVGISADRAGGAYDVAMDGSDFAVTTAAGTHVARSDHRTHWQDDAGAWNFAPYHHEVILGASLKVSDPCVDDPLDCDPSDPILDRILG